MSEAVSVPSLMMMTLIFSEESLARVTQTHRQTDRQTETARQRQWERQTETETDRDRDRDRQENENSVLLLVTSFKPSDTFCCQHFAFDWKATIQLCPPVHTCAVIVFYIKEIDSHNSWNTITILIELLFGNHFNKGRLFHTDAKSTRSIRPPICRHPGSRLSTAHLSSPRLETVPDKP